MLRRVTLSTMSAAVIGAIIAGTLLVILGQAGKALGLGDEGIYLLAARYPNEVKENVSSIFRFTGYLFYLVGYDPTYFRASGVVLIVLSSVVLWAGLRKVLARRFDDHLFGANTSLLSLLFIVIGSLLHYQWSYLTPSYYAFSALAVNFVTGLLLLGLSCLDKDGPELPIYGTLLGFIFGITLFAKFPTAFPLALSTAVAIAFWHGPARRLRYVAWILAGLLGWLVLSFSVEQSPAQALHRFLKGWQIYQVLGFHNPVDKLMKYPTDMLVLVWTAIYTLWPGFLVLIVGTIVLRRPGIYNREQKFLRFRSWWSWLTVGLAAVASVPGLIFVDVPDRLISTPINGVTRPYIASQLGWMLLLAGLLIATVRRREVIFDTRVLIVLFLLFTAPLAGSLGTSNPLYNVIQFYAAPWFGAMFVLLLLLTANHTISARFAVCVVLFVGVYAASNTVQGSVYQPAQVKPQRMADQVYPTAVGEPPFYLDLNEGTHRLVDQLSKAARANGFEPGGDIIGFNEIAGLVYALGGRSPGHPVFPCCRAGSNAYSKIVLTFASPDRLKKAFILLDVDPESDVVGLLAGVGINFPGDYLAVGTSTALGRTFRLYKPRTR